MLKRNVDLSKYSNYKIGGPAAYFAEPKSQEELLRVFEEWKKFGDKKSPVFILGGGTNLLIDDKGFDGLVVKPGLTSLDEDNHRIKAGAGVLMEDLLDFTISNQCSGLEWAGGLPGTLGGAIRGNAGAFGGEIKDIVEEVQSLDISGDKPCTRERTNKECLFGYRTSIFKERGGEEIILSATLNMKKGDKEKIKDAIEEKIRYRAERHPMEYPNIGSIFKNVDWKKVPMDRKAELRPVVKTDPQPVVPTAYLIHKANLKGVTIGGAMVSPKHPNFIVNVLDAKAEDVKKLISLVKVKIEDQFGVTLEEEVTLL